MAMKGVHKPQNNLARQVKQPKFQAKDYQTSAHTDTHHGQGGSATGSPRDSAPMDYDRKTFAEGAKSQPVAGHPGNTNMGLGHGPHLVGSSRTPATGADGYRHAAHKRSGVLRNSGHPGAHRVGKR